MNRLNNQLGKSLPFKATPIVCNDQDVQNALAWGIDVGASVQVDMLFEHMNSSFKVGWHQKDWDTMNKTSKKKGVSITGIAPPNNLVSPVRLERFG